MQTWFEDERPELDEWTLWTTRELLQSVEAIEGYIRSLPSGFAVPSLQDALRFGERSPHGTVFIFSLLSDTRLLAAQEDDDERSYLATPPDADGRCQVFLFNPRQICLEDWGWPSIHDWLTSLDTDERKLQPVAAPARAQSCSWLTSALFGIGYSNVKDDVAGARAFSEFNLEATQTRGDLLYWLWHHAVAGNRQALSALMARNEGTSDPWVAQSIAWIRAHGEPWNATFEALTPKRVLELRAALAPECRE